MEYYNFIPRPINTQRDGIPFEDVLSKIDSIALEIVTCPICLKLVWDIVDCKQCGNVFCRCCILELIKKINDSCPIFKQSPFKTTGSKTIKKILSNIRIKCPNSSCQENPFYSDYMAHQEKCIYRKYCCRNKGCYYQNCLNNKDDMIAHSKACEFKEIQCKYYGKMIKEIKIKEHEKNFCKELFQCSICHTKMRKYDYLNCHDKYRYLQCKIDYYTKKSIIKKGTIESPLKNSIDELKNIFYSKIEELNKEKEILFKKNMELSKENQKLQRVINSNNNPKNLENKNMLNKKRKRTKVNDE